ncbi:MAG: pyrroloquinoline quinone-dependent dehydrogenase [Gemmatimonadetes bacterium]|nr:pyrroloquinoline quinone-dependent dehydrogenase [Gemmatimonadota bacterium]
MRSIPSPLTSCRVVTQPTRIALIALFALVVFVGCAAPSSDGGDPAAPASAGHEWRAYGGDPGGTRYSSLTQVHRGNVASLRPAWVAHTGDLSHKRGDEGSASGCGRCHTGDTKFEATPLAVDGALLLSTPLNRVLALDPATGRERWRFDPHLALNIERNEGFVSRGVSFWEDRRAAGAGAASAACARRVFMATVDARLFALDASTGGRCASFGDSGVVRLDLGVGEVQVGQYGVTSPPAVIGDVVVVGSAIGDNRRVDLERGTVRAFDARTGVLRWAFDPIQRRPGEPGYDTWTPAAATRTGAANAWAPLSADTARGLVFVPTGSASPDFYGGERLGSNLYANSVVALEAETGRIRWHFQVVHHDLWDYDVAAQPTLVDIDREGRRIPAVVVATKMGFLYVLDRTTGTPIFPVEERAVPASDVPGERTSPTQPFPLTPGLRLNPTRITEDDVWGPTPADRAACLAQFKAFRHGEMFTPPSLEGTLSFPGYPGGVNWGGVTVDPQRQLLIVNTMRLAAWVKLVPRMGSTSGNQIGTPYHMERAVWAGPSGLPCQKGPWGMLTAIDLRTGTVKWERPLGGLKPGGALPAPVSTWGSPNFGGSLATAGGLIFIAAGMDEQLRAIDIETGRDLWSAKLPAGGQATPMTYTIGGRQYIVIAAGGHGSLGTTLGDQVVAFTLP